MAQIMLMTNQTTEEKQKNKCINKSRIIWSCINMNFILIIIVAVIMLTVTLCILGFVTISTILQYEYSYQTSDKCIWTNITVVNGHCNNKKIIPFETMQIQYVFAHITHNITKKQFVCTKEELAVGCTNTEFKLPSPDTKCGSQFEVNERINGEYDDCYFPDQYDSIFLYEKTSKIVFGTKTKYTQLSEIVMNGWIIILIIGFILIAIFCPCLLVLYLFKEIN